MGLLEEAKSKIRQALGLTMGGGAPEQAVGPLAEAERLLKQALAEEVPTAEIHLTYARLLHERKRYEEAEIQYQQAQKLDPTNDSIRVGREKNAAKMQVDEEPADLPEPPVELSPQPPFGGSTPLSPPPIPEPPVPEPQRAPPPFFPDEPDIFEPIEDEAKPVETSSEADEHWAWGSLLKDEQGDLAGAEEAFQRALEYDPRHRPTLKTYSLLLLTQERYNEAEDYLADLVEVDPSGVDECLAEFPVESEAPFLALRGKLYMRQGEQDEAELRLRQALELAPEQVDWLVTYSQLLHDLNRTSEAVERLRGAFEQGLETAALHREYARLMADAGRYDEVEAHLKQALAIGPDDPETLALQSEWEDKLAAYRKARGRMALAIMRAKEGLDLEARKLFEEALDIDNEHLPTLKAYADFLERQHDFSEAEQMWAMVATKAPEEAEAHFQAVLKTRGENRETLNSLARVLTQLDRLAEAETHLRRSLSLEPHNAETLHLLTDVLNQQDRRQEAEILLQENRPTVENDAKLSLRYAQLLAARYNYTEAKKFYKQAQALDPADDEIAQAYATAAERIEKFERANMDMALGWMEAQSGNVLEAERLYQQALATDPQHVPTLQRYASLLENTGRAAEAGDYLRQLVQLDPMAAEAHYRTLDLENNPERRCAYALLLQNMGRSTDAMEQLQLVLASQPTYPAALAPYATMLLDEGQVKEAEEMLKLALSQDDSSAEIHWQYAKLLADYRHRYGLAGLHFKRAAALSEALTYQDDYDKIKEKLEQIREAEYEWALAHMEGTSPEEAEALFQRAYSLCPDHIPVLIDYGKFLRQQGRPEEARRYLAEACDLDPYDEDAAQLLGELNYSRSETSFPAEDEAELSQEETEVSVSPQVELTATSPESINLEENPNDGRASQD